MSLGILGFKRKPSFHFRTPLKRSNSPWGDSSFQKGKDRAEDVFDPDSEYNAVAFEAPFIVLPNRIPDVPTGPPIEEFTFRDIETYYENERYIRDLDFAAVMEEMRHRRALNPDGTRVPTHISLLDEFGFPAESYEATKSMVSDDLWQNHANPRDSSTSSVRMPILWQPPGQDYLENRRRSNSERDFLTSNLKTSDLFVGTLMAIQNRPRFREDPGHAIRTFVRGEDRGQCWDIRSLVLKRSGLRMNEDAFYARTNLSRTHSRGWRSVLKPRKDVQRGNLRALSQTIGVPVASMSRIKQKGESDKSGADDKRFIPEKPPTSGTPQDLLRWAIKMVEEDYISTGGMEEALKTIKEDLPDLNAALEEMKKLESSSDVSEEGKTLEKLFDVLKPLMILDGQKLPVDEEIYKLTLQEDFKTHYNEALSKEWSKWNGRVWSKKEETMPTFEWIVSIASTFFLRTVTEYIVNVQGGTGHPLKEKILSYFRQTAEKDFDLWMKNFSQALNKQQKSPDKALALLMLSLETEGRVFLKRNDLMDDQQDEGSVDLDFPLEKYHVMYSLYKLFLLFLRLSYDTTPSMKFVDYQRIRNELAELLASYKGEDLSTIGHLEGFRKALGGSLKSIEKVGE